MIQAEILQFSGEEAAGNRKNTEDFKKSIIITLIKEGKENSKAFIYNTTSVKHFNCNYTEKSGLEDHFREERRKLKLTIEKTKQDIQDSYSKILTGGKCSRY